MKEGFRPTEFVSRAALDNEYDPEHFEQAVQTLLQEFEQAPPKEREAILVGRYIDGAQYLLGKNPRATNKETTLFERFGMRPMPMDTLQAEINEQVKIDAYRTALLGGKQNSAQVRSNGVLYGPSRIFNLASNEIMSATLGDQDIVSTARLSSCTALVLQEGRKVTMAHITTFTDIFEASKSLLEKARQSGAVFTVIAPTFSAIQGDSESAKFVADQQSHYAALFGAIKQEANKASVALRSGGYPYISFHTDRDRRISESAAMVGKDFCATIGYSWVPDAGLGNTFNFYPDTTQTIS